MSGTVSPFEYRSYRLQWNKNYESIRFAASKYNYNYSKRQQTKFK